MSTPSPPRTTPIEEGTAASAPAPPAPPAKEEEPAQQPAAAQPSDLPSASEGSSSASEEEEEEDGDDDYRFENDAEAEAARAVGLAAYNEGRYDDALDQQYRVVRYFSEKYGATSPQCGKYFLDYGLSQLRLLQSESSVDATLQPRDQDAMEACFINLEVARVSLQKVEQEKGDDDVETELALGEVHNALAQLNTEKEDYEAALREYEAELLIYRGLQESSPAAVLPRRIVSTLYGIADCFMKEGDFEGAEERLQVTLAEIEKSPAGSIPAELVEELKDVLADAREMKGGKFKEIQEAIKQQFAADAESIPTAHEFYDIGGEKGKHPFLSSLPGGSGEANEGSSCLSMPMSAMGQALAMNEHSNSQSISLFPPQGSSRSGPPGSNSNGPVQHIMARKKPKVASVSADRGAAASEPEAKKARTE